MQPAQLVLRDQLARVEQLALLARVARPDPPAGLPARRDPLVLQVRPVLPVPLVPAEQPARPAQLVLAVPQAQPARVEQQARLALPVPLVPAV